MAREQLEAFMRDHGVVVTSIFIPWSKSRNFASHTPIDKRNLNWRVTIECDGRPVLSTDYAAGIAYAPSYKHGQRITLDVEEALIHETERGTKFGRTYQKTEHIWPDACDVLASLALDSSVLNEGSFENWADSLGYDKDSRSAEAIYKACVDIALQLSAGLSATGVLALRNAAQDY